MGTVQRGGMLELIWLSRWLTREQKTIKFINDEASSIHGSLKVGTIYTSESGEWKLGGLEVLSSIKDDEALIYVCQVTRNHTTPLTQLELWKSCSRFRSLYPSRVGTIRLGCYQT